MFEYLTGLSEGNSYAVVNTEGKICVVASESAVKEEAMLRHYAFLLDYMSVPVDKILFVTLDDTVVKNLVKRFHNLYPNLSFEITPINKVQNIKRYDYVLVRDAHNVDIFTKGAFSSLCEKAKNLYVFINASNIKKHPNIDLAEYLETADFDFEIDTDGQYSIGHYLHDVEDWLERRRKERELEEKRRKEAAEREAARKAKEEAERKAREEAERIAREEAERKAREEAERKAAEERVRKEAERKAAEERARRAREEAERRAREEAERKAREEAERKAREEAERIAREKAAEEARRKAIEEETKRRLAHPYYKKLQPYISWYKNNWAFMVEHGSYRWQAVEHFQENFDLNATNLSGNLEKSFSKCGELMTGVLLRSQKLLIKCAATCPNDTRLLLRNLVNEDDSFSFRMMLYRNMTDRLAEEMRGRSAISSEEISHLNNVRATTTYLSLVHPDKHYLYKLFPFQQFCSKVGIKAPSVTEFENEYEKFEEICDKVREVLMFDKELLQMNDASYANDISDYHILTFDFIYAIGYHLVDISKRPKQ